jgi:DNA (cytosine-5)-methyltransferase 1
VTFGSVCSGIEAATVAWRPLGWKPAWFAEIDPFCSALLKFHYPEVRNYGDFTRIGADAGPIDVLVGGTPCQSFSVAGRRAGLDDPRGNLTLEYLALAGRLRPRWLVWENVPGVLSIDGGRTFGTFLGLLGELGYGFAYRVLDAQYFGVPQRRRRVFVVGHLGDWRRAAAVLFERESLSGNPAPSGKARQGLAGTLGVGSGERGWCPDTDRMTFVAFGGGNTSGPIDVATALTHHGVRQDFDTETFIAHTLRGEGFDASEDGTGRGVPLVPIAFDTTQITSKANRSNPKPGDPCHPLAAGAHAPALAFNLRGRDGGAMPEVADVASVRAASGGSSRSYVSADMAVRRLTARECERLQGFEDDYTLIPYRGKPAADGPRYRAIGNSMAVPVMRWIGERIDQVERIPVNEW